MSRLATEWLVENLPVVRSWSFTDNKGNNQRIGENGLALMMFLCDAANDKNGGSFYMGHKYIAEAIGIHDKAVSRMLGVLERLGAIQRIGEARQGRGRPTVEYVLTCVPKYRALIDDTRASRLSADYVTTNGRLTDEKVTAQLPEKTRKPRREKENGKIVESEPEPKPQPEPESHNIAHDSSWGQGQGKEKENPTDLTATLKNLSEQCIAEEAIQITPLTSQRMRANRRREYLERLSNYLHRFPDVSHDLLVACAIDAQWNRGNPENALEAAQTRAAHNREVARWHGQTAEERAAEREQDIASKEFVQQITARMFPKVPE